MRDPRPAVFLSRARIAVGVAALIAPRLAGRIIGGRQATPPTALFARMLGARDLALGLGTVIALDRGAPVRGWLEASALADACDCIATLLAREHLSPAVIRATAGSAAASTVIGIVMARQLDQPLPADPGHPEAIITGHPQDSVTVSETSDDPSSGTGP